MEPSVESCSNWHITCWALCQDGSNLIATGVAADAYLEDAAVCFDAADPEAESYLVLVLLALDILALPFFADAVVEGAGVKFSGLLLCLSGSGDDVGVSESWGCFNYSGYS